MAQRIVSTPKKLPASDLALFYRPNSIRGKQSLYSRIQASPEVLKREVLLIINVDIGTGEGKVIEVRRGDAPRRLAEEFCQKHGLDGGLVGVLERQVMREMEGIGETRVAMRTEEDERLAERVNLMKTEEERGVDDREERQRKPQENKHKIKENRIGDKLFINQAYSDSKGKRLEYWDRFMSEKKAKPEENPNKNFTFSPEINPISQEIMKSKNKGSVYKRLYFEVTNRSFPKTVINRPKASQPTRSMRLRTRKDWRGSSIRARVR